MDGHRRLGDSLDAGAIKRFPDLFEIGTSRLRHRASRQSEADP